MAHQHIFTSAAQGLKPGTRGFTTVGASRELSSTLIGRLELLSGYTLPAATGDTKEKLAPVNYMHVKLTVGGEKHTLVSRIAPAGVDYTGRSNTLAHHLIIPKNEESPAGPAWLAMQSGLLLTQWSGQPRPLPSIPIPPGLVHGKPCTTWAKVLGDASYAGSLVAPIINQPGRPIVLIHTPEQAPDIPAMLFEAMAILPSQLRWDVTFSTYFTSAAPDVHCRVRCVLSTDPLAEQVRRVASVVLLDLTQKTNGRPIPGEPFETCRKGGTWPDLSPATDVSEETSDKVHPAAAKMLRAKPVPQIQDLLLAELPDEEPSGVHPVAPQPVNDELAKSRAARKNDSSAAQGILVASVGAAVGIAAVTVGAYYLFSSSTPPPPAPETFEDRTPRPRVVTPVKPPEAAPGVGAPAGSPQPIAPSVGRYAISTSGQTGDTSTPAPAPYISAPNIVDSTPTVSPTPSSAGIQITTSNVLGAMSWGGASLFDRNNTLFAKYAGAGADLPANQAQRLIYEGNTLVAKFPGPFSRTITEATSFDIIINLPFDPRGLRTTILREDPTVVEVSRPGNELASQTIIAKFTIAKLKDNSQIKLTIEQGTVSLSEQLTGASLIIQPATSNFDGKQDDWRKSLLLAFLPDPASSNIVIDVPVYASSLDKPNPALNSVQAAQFSRLQNWHLVTQPQTPVAGWAEYLISSTRAPSNNDISPDAAFTPFIRQASNDFPQPQADIIVRAAEIKSLWDIRKDLGKRKAAADASKAKLKETIEKVNAQGQSESSSFRAVLPNIPAADIVKDLESDGKRMSDTASPILGTLLSDVKIDARKARDDDAAYQAALKSFSALVQNVPSAKYEGYDVFGNVAATVTFNIVKTGEAAQPTGRTQSISTTTDTAPGSTLPATSPDTRPQP